MSAPERVNVLLSRARDGLIMIGNSDTFTQARKGKAVWQQLFAMLRDRGHIYDGLPVKCEQHPYRTALLSTESEFEKDCPDGGCLEPWQVSSNSLRITPLTQWYSSNATLDCGLHACPSLCHRLQDHSKMRCRQKITSQCLEGHSQSRECSERALQCCRRCTNTGPIQQEELLRKLDRDPLSLDWRTARQTPSLDARRGLPSLQGFYPRSKPSESIAAELETPSSDSDDDTTETSKAKMDAKKNIEWGVDEFFVTRTLAKAEGYFSLLPSRFHYLFVEKLVLRAAKSKRADAQLVAELFASVSSKHLSRRGVLEKGFRRAAKQSGDIAIDYPMAPELIDFIVSRTYRLD